MKKVIDGRKHFQLKAALDGASQNLSKIHSSVIDAQILDAGDAQASMLLTQRFLEGGIEPFPVPLEDSDILYDLMDNKEVYGRIIKTIYAYKADPGLTLALALRFPDAPLMKVVTADGYLLSTGLWSVEKQCLLTVNGAHERQALLDHMTGKNLGGAVNLVTTSASELSSLTAFSEADLQIALGQFGFVAQFMLEHLDELIAEPKSWTIDEDDEWLMEP